MSWKMKLAAGAKSTAPSELELGRDETQWQDGVPRLKLGVTGPAMSIGQQFAGRSIRLGDLHLDADEAEGFGRALLAAAASLRVGREQQGGADKCWQWLIKIHVDRRYNAPMGFELEMQVVARSSQEAVDTFVASVAKVCDALDASEGEPHSAAPKGPGAARAEALAVTGLSDHELLRRAIVHVTSGESPPRSRWSHVGRTFGVGSTSATALCRRFGVDPDDLIGLAEDEDEEGSDDE